MRASQAIRIARRVRVAAESSSLETLDQELHAAERFADQEEERLELLGAIARDIRTNLDPGGTAPLADAFSPHIQLLRHLSNSRVWAN